jgi:hypothetical protein
MAGLDIGGMIEIGQRAGDFQNAIVGSGTQAHFSHGMFQVPPGVVSNLAMAADLPGRHLGVAINVLPAKTFLLQLPGFQNALPDLR